MHKFPSRTHAQFNRGPPISPDRARVLMQAGLEDELISGTAGTSQSIYTNTVHAPPVRAMTSMGYASLTSEQVKRVQRCEEELGVTILAYAKPVYAQLSENDLKRIQDLEKDLRLSLVAYEV